MTVRSHDISSKVSTLTLLRAPSTEQGTLGILFRPDGSRMNYTLELPWKENLRRKSCIPTGLYPVKLVLSPRRGQVYLVLDVPSRDSILIHSGNVAGDVEEGWESDVLGCILLGEYRGTRRGQLAIFNSKVAIRHFMEEMTGKPLKLDVRGV